MPYLTIFIISFTIALSGALAPGPLLAAVIYESARKGFKAGPLMILGHALLEIAMVAFLILGFARFINNPLILKIISLLGALVLFYFGITMFLSLPRLSLDLKHPNHKSSPLALMGITMSLANPYWTIWWATIGLGLVLAAQKQGFIAIVVFFIGHILADFGWYSIVSLTISKGRKFISPRVYKSVISVCATILIGFALWFAITSFP